MSMLDLNVTLFDVLISTVICAGFIWFICFRNDR